MADEIKFRQKREFLIQREKRECILEVLPVAHVSSDTNRTLSAVGTRSGQLVEQAGEYAEIFALRAYDSIQLAAVKTLQQGGSEKVSFACFNQRLQKAAQLLGLLPIAFYTPNKPAS